MKSTIKLSAQSRNKLTERLASIKEALRTFKKASAELSKFQKRKDELELEVLDLEDSIDPTEEKEIEKLTSKKTQLALLVRRLPETEAGRDNALARLKSNGAVGNVHDLISEVMQPAWRELVSEITDVFAPYFRQKEKALQAARTTDAVFSLQSFMTYRYGISTGDVVATEAAIVIQVFETLLDGKMPAFPSYEMPAAPSVASSLGMEEETARTAAED